MLLEAERHRNCHVGKVLVCERDASRFLNIAPALVQPAWEQKQRGLAQGVELGGKDTGGGGTPACLPLHPPGGLLETTAFLGGGMSVR